MGGEIEDPHMPLGAVTKVAMGEKCEDPHTPWGRNQLLKVDGGRNVKTLTCPLGQKCDV